MKFLRQIHTEYKVGMVVNVYSKNVEVALFVAMVSTRLSQQTIDQKSIV